jgi:serine/threonine-protein kinase
MEPIAQLKTALADRYDIAREIGRGGMATVYLARDVRHDRSVALKVLNPELGAVLGVERFLAEIKVTANLQHPNLLPLFDSGESAGLLFYVMPYVEGESLRARLDREKQLPIDEALRIAIAVASALDYAHRHGVIHRDLKPENILLQEGQPLIADFGIALAVSNAGGSRITQTGLSLGTPQYMSPEQATGDRAIDGRTDIYSLGAMLYEMLTGEAPHTGNTAQAIIARVLTEQPRSVRSSRPNVPEHVELALQRALEKLPADRWATAGQFADALSGKTGSAPEYTAAMRARAGGQRASGWRAQLRNPVVAVLGVIAIASSVLAVRGWRSAPAGESTGPVRFPLTMPPDARLYSAITGRTLAISPDGNTIVFVGVAVGGTSKLYARSLSDVAPHAIPGTDGGRQPFFSPDGHWVGFWADRKIQKTTLEGGSPFPLADTPIYQGAAWSPSGDIVISDGIRLLAVSENGGSLRSLTHPDSAHGELLQLWPVAIADGRVLYASWDAGGLSKVRIGVLSMSSHTTSILDATGSHPVGVVGGYLVYANSANALMAVPFDGRAAHGAATPLINDLVAGAGGIVNVALSFNGTLIHAIGSAASQVVSVDMHGATRPLLADARAFAHPRYSPDGQRLLLSISTGTRRDVWVHDMTSATSTRLTTEGTFNERAEWSPDGKRVAYRTDRGHRSAIWWQAADLSDAAKPLVASEHTDFYEGVLTPNGAIVYQVDTTGADVEYRMLSGDTTPKPVATTRFQEYYARVSLDGRWVAYQTDEPGTNEIVVQPFPGPGARVQVSDHGGTEPVWARDGSHLYYRDGQRIVAVTYVTTPKFTITSRAPLFDDVFVLTAAPHANYDVAPNGQGFAFIKAVSDPQVIVVHNWVAEVRERLATKR